MLSFPFLRSPDQCQQSSICVRFVRGEWAPLLDPPVRWGGPAAWDRDGRNRTFRFPQLLRNIITSLLLSSPSAGFDLNPKVPLLPVLHKRTPRGGRVSFWTAACPSGCTNSDKSLSTSTARSRANPEPADTRGWSDLTACRHMGACTRARTHTLTLQITSGMEKAAADWAAEPSLIPRGQGDFTRLFPFPPPPPYGFI